jgi:hypothetical protein
MEAIKTKRFITDRTGKKTDAIIDIKTYEKILEDLEEFYLIKHYDNSKKKTDQEIKNKNYITLNSYSEKRKIK